MNPSELSAFREEVRTFVRDNLDAETAAKVARGRKLDKHDYVGWQKTLQKRGWLLGAWPKTWGGEGWGAEQQLAFLQETSLSGAPMIIPYGVNMLGPVLNTFGTEAQKQRYIPGIVNSDTWWCQGYSEPGAGSDLASLKTTAVRDGDVYRVSGSKMWTTEAHWADMMHCLVRTSSEGRKQDGISFLLINMRAKGISVRPIVTIDGQHHTNQIFLDDVIVPAEDLVGQENQGWTIAKFLLSHERLSIADTGAKLRLLQTMRRKLAHVRGTGEEAPEIIARLQARLTDIGVQVTALRAMETYLVSSWSRGRPEGVDASILKVRSTELLQAMTELAMDLSGPYAGVHDPNHLHQSMDGEDSPTVQASAMAHQYLYARCWSIFGGTNEVQRNIIAKHVL